MTAGAAEDVQSSVDAAHSNSPLHLSTDSLPSSLSPNASCTPHNQKKYELKEYLHVKPQPLTCHAPKGCDSVERVHVDQRQKDTRFTTAAPLVVLCQSAKRKWPPPLPYPGQFQHGLMERTEDRPISWPWTSDAKNRNHIR